MADTNTSVTALVAGALTSLAADVSSPVVAQVLKIAGMLINAWPAIKAGLQSEQPFLDAIGQIMQNGTTGVTSDEFDEIVAGLKAQIATVQGVVDADTAAGY